MFKHRATLSWVMLARFGAPPYIAVDYYMEVLPAPNLDAAASAIVTVGAGRLRKVMPRGPMEKCRLLATRFSNQVEDWSLLTAEQTLRDVRFLLHTILTTDDLQLLHAAALAWNNWIPFAERLQKFARELDKWRELPPVLRPGVKPKPSRKKIRAGRGTPSMFS